MKIRTLFAAALAILPAVSHAWWNDEWQYRKKLTVNAGDEAQEAMLLVRLHTGNFTYFTDVKPNGADLRFVAGDDKTPLTFNIEKYDAANQMAMIWVRLPSVKKGDTLWLYYGNPKAEQASEGEGSYGDKQTLVYHFNSNSAPSDITAFGNHPQRFTAQPVTSLIGYGAKFLGTSDIVTSSNASLAVDPAKGWTFSTWVKLDGEQSGANVMQIGNTLALGIDGSTPYVRYGAQKSNGTPSLSTGWHHLAATVTTEGVALYVDGKAAGALTVQTAPLNNALTIGSGFKGEMDEVEVAAAVRDTAWLNFAVASQGTNSALLTLGDDEARDGEESKESSSYFGIIMQNVTTDGWVVIGILMIMAVISWLIMLAKGVLLSRVGRDNRSFLEQFGKLGLDNSGDLDGAVAAEEQTLEDAPFLMALFGKHDHFQSSPLYRIYHTGVQELEKRVGRAAGAQASGLSPQAVAAIRASLDATMVRETQKLNAQMVLLTIAVSGGPFLGLLGTVVGVMITFAAIAASGDVNINAIAPGIAAALVATVAGLAVAIPALFGYNYLSSRVRDAVAEMQVFVDEFIGKIAEHHGR